MAEAQTIEGDVEQEGGKSATAVKMQNGEVIDFPGTRKMKKQAFVSPEGKIICKFYFSNGQVREIQLRDDMLQKYAGHGALQKIGDSAAGEKDVDDMVEAVGSTIDQLNTGPDGWNVQREAGGFSGTSIVIRAVAEVTGKEVDVVKAGIEKKLEELKAAGKATTRQSLYASFRQNPKIAAVIRRIEEEKAKKTAADVDTESILSEFRAVAGAA